MEQAESRRVVVAEDDYLVGTLIVGLLQKLGYTVVGQATTGARAVEMVESLRPDVVLMDIGLPDGDGIEAARLIGERCPTPVVIMTAYDSADLVQRASAAGVGAYLVKPPDAGQMERGIVIARQRFADLAESRRLNAELRASEERMRLLLESADDLIVMQDVEGKYLYYNGAPRFGVAASDIIGRRPDEFHEAAAAAGILARIRSVVDAGVSVSAESCIAWQGSELWFLDQLSPIRDAAGRVVAVVTVSHNITERKRAEDALRAANLELESRLREIKTLQGYLPICASCKKIRDDQGYWHAVEVYIRDHTDVEFTHGLCPECAKKLMDEMDSGNDAERRDVNIEGLLLDIDGVLTIRSIPIPGATAALADLRRRGMPFRLLTNITMRSRAEVAAGMQRAGFVIESGQIFTAASLAAHYLRTHGGPRSWVLLHGSAGEDFAGLDLGEAGAEFVVLGDLGDAFEAGIMNRIYRALLAGARLIAVQHNRAWIAADGPRLDVGAWVAALEFASGQPALVMGKPSPLAYQIPAADLGLPPERLAMLSDDPDVDLAGARAAGLRTIFVRTSAVPGRRAVAAGEFDYALDSIADLPTLLES